jgi:hypothetical protein
VRGNAVAPGRKVVLAVGAAVLAVASPLAYTLAPAGVGDAVSASVIAATAIAALAVPLWSGRSDGTKPSSDASADAVAAGTGRAKAASGGNANTGVRRQHGAGGAARAEHTGDAVAQGQGSRANTGVEEAD